MSQLVTARIRGTAAKLGLPHLAEILNQYVERAEEGKLGYLDFLDLVLAEELAVRDDRRFRQGLRLSKLPHHKTLDDYDFSFQPELDPRKVKDLATRWGQVFGDGVLATAILDRLLHHCDVIAINGPGYRLKNRLAAIERETDVA
ncbi:ATP-binding protein [Streptomyces sp. NPDC058086]|uniref:ATP-binding protein n=1 Tax=Streptomyces sp. NPDC058086 TaxID=3346334 RepID=UPI0036E20B83